MVENAVVITYNDQLEQLLKENSEECESLSILHRMSYEKYNKRSNYINIPVIILSSAIGFITGIDLQYDQMNVILGVGSVFVGIIKSVDTYFQLAKRAESHRICSLQFSQISKKLQIELTLHRRQRATAENMMNIVKTDIKNMQDIAPLIDDDIIEIYNSKYRRYKRVKKPNFVNGLTEVKVNPYNNEREYEFASRHGSREASPSNTNVVDNQQPSIPSHTPSQHNSNNPPPPPFQDKNQNPNIDQNEDNLSVEPVDVTTDPNAMINQGTNNVQLLQMYQQLQAQAQAASVAAAASQRQSMSPSQIQLQVHSQTQSPMQNASSLPNVQPSQSPTLQNNIVVPSAGPSPATSVRSTASLHLGQIQTDPNGNQGMNI
jgi:DNA polymerase III gamma/tau subunit